jgi:hypothetical protein
LGAALMTLALPFAVVSTLYAFRMAWLGADLGIMRELGRRWFETGTMYLPYQLTGPYSIDVQDPLTNTPALYPPAAGPVFAAVWALPEPRRRRPVVGRAVRDHGLRLRPLAPAAAGVGADRAMFAHPMSALHILSGGTAMWAMALVAAGLLWHWPPALILLKPTLLPFALIGIRHRSWWIVAGGDRRPDPARAVARLHRGRAQRLAVRERVVRGGVDRLLGDERPAAAGPGDRLPTA